MSDNYYTPRDTILPNQADEGHQSLNLYEVRNGYIGFAQERVYVWAKDEAQAVELARESYKNERELEANYWDSSRFTIKLCFSATAAPFATKPSDSGFFDDF